MLTICLPVRLGKACAISATAPLIVGAEKLVPDQRNCAPVSSGARSLIAERRQIILRAGAGLVREIGR